MPDGEEVDGGLDPLDPSDDVEAVEESGYYAGKGCGCATGSTPRASWLAPLLGLLLWRRRRS